MKGYVLARALVLIFVIVLLIVAARATMSSAQAWVSTFLFALAVFGLGMLGDVEP